MRVNRKEPGRLLVQVTFTRRKQPQAQERRGNWISWVTCAVTVTSLYTSSDVTPDCSQLLADEDFFTLFWKKKTVSTQIIRVQGQQSAQHQRRMFRDETIYFKKTVEPEKAFLFLQN